MKQIFKYILISAVMVLSISSCQEEMVDPNAGVDEITADRISSVREQMASVELTSDLLENYAAALASDKDVPGLEAADEEISEAVSDLKAFVKSYSSSDDLQAVTAATIQMHAQISSILAKVPATVEVMMVLSPSEELAASYATLKKDHIDDLQASLGNWIGRGLLPDLFSREKLSLQLSLIKEQIVYEEHPFAAQITSIIEDFESHDEGVMSSEDFMSLMSSVVENNGGMLNAEVESKIKEYNDGVDALLEEVGSAYKYFASDLGESVRLLAPVQSVVYMSDFDKDVALAEYSYNGSTRVPSDIEMNFTVRPAAVAAKLVENWSTYMSLVAYKPGSGAALAANSPTIKDVMLEGDILTVVVDPANISGGVYSGTENLALALQLSNGVKLLASDFVGLTPKKMPGLFFTYGHENISVVKGAQKSMQFSYSADSDVEVIVNGNEFIGYGTLSSLYKNFKTGYVAAFINEAYDVSKQKVDVTLKADGETVTKTITFKEVGYFDISVPYVIPAAGGSVTLGISTNISMDRDVQISSSASWLTYGSGQFTATANTSSAPRVATASYEITTGGNSFTKNVNIVQYGTSSGSSCYEMFLGDWKMTAYNGLTGTNDELNVTIVKDPTVSYGYLVYGLAPGSGLTHPVKMTYSNTSGNMTLTLPQEGLSESQLGMYPVSLSGSQPVVSTSSKTFTFTWNGSAGTLTANTSSSSSFMYAVKDGSTYTPNISDKVFYTSASMKRADIEYLTSGQRYALQTASAGKTYPLNIIILGDGYQKKDLQENGKFERSAQSAMNTIFAYEPFASFRDRFSVYMIPYESTDEGTSIENEGVTKNTRYGMTCRSNGNTLLNAPHGYDNVWTDIANAGFSSNDVYKSLVIMLVNTDLASGTCAQIESGTTTNVAVSGDGYKSKSVAMLAANNSFGTNGLVIHEAGGHGFGRLADEYTSNSGNTFTGHATLQNSHNNGFYWNVSPYQDYRCPWYKFYTNSQYSGKVGFYESAYNCQYGIYRPSESSIMLNNTGTFNVISRWAIYRRIIMTSEGGGNENDVLDRFLEYDKKNL